MTPYETVIRKIAPNYDPRQVEAFMRLEYGTLDHLPPAKFRHEVRIACECIDADPDLAEQCAQSYGF